MANRNITIEIMTALEDYTQDVIEDIEKVAEKVAKDGAKKLKATSPKLTGDYAKGWRAKKIEGGWSVHNAKKPQLTHLLEMPHALVNGGRSSPQVHIKPVEEEMIKEYEKGVEEAIRNG